MNSSRASRLLKFVAQSVIAGLAGAFILLYLFPGLLSGNSSQPDNGLATTDSQIGGQAGVVSYSEAVAAVAPAVVNVYATQIRRETIHPLFHDPLFQHFFGRPVPKERRDNSLGSGVIMDSQGYLLTNAHVINNADEILITLHDGRQTAAKIVGIDVETDLAVLQIELDNLSVAPTSDSSRTKVGDVVLAIGNPYDFGHTVTQGIVSATGRNRLGITTFEEFIQTDAAINPGNSGGALVSASGKLIGINTAIISSSGGSQGLGFAIPVNPALGVMRQIIEYGYVIRGWLGVETQVVPQDIADAAELDEGGILVVAVFSGGPAAEAGIRPGDIMIKINDQPLFNPQQGIKMVSQFVPGSNIDIEILRGWERKTLMAQLAERPAHIH